MNCGIMIKISLNFDRSELGQTLKSSIICNSEVTHRNCKTSESKFVFFASNINTHDIKNNIIVETISVNHHTQENIINHAKKYITFSECFTSFNQIYKSKFQKIALQIYHHIKTILLHHQAVTATQLQSLLISIDLTLHQVIIAQKP